MQKAMQPSAVIRRERIQAAYRQALVQTGGDARLALKHVGQALEHIARERQRPA